MQATAHAQGELAPQRAPSRAAIPAPEVPGGQTPIGPPSLPQTASRELMWSAPTAEDWLKPCLITFQRTWDDALAVAKQTNRPILVCVNMDGEIASEHYAGLRYRQADIAALYGPYVCVIASVYRHTPRDFDEAGQRILCPRFGSVTCGEHIAIEPLLFEKFMEGRRISPRHICVEINEQLAETFDVFYAWDTASVFQTIVDGAADRPPPTPVAHGDRPMLERAASRDIVDRTAVERAYTAADTAGRRRLLEAALSHRELDSVDLLRLALFGFDAELAQLARRALAQCETESAIDLIGEVLRVSLEAEERELLVVALERLGQTFPRARTLAAVHRGLAGHVSALDVDGWAKALAGGGSGANATDRATLETRVAYQAEATDADPRDAQSRVALAETYIALAADPRTTRRFSRVMLEDAKRAAAEAQALGVTGWRVNAAHALAAFRLGEMSDAYARAEAAVAELPADVSDENSMLVVALFAEGRQKSIWQAMREKKDWPSAWLTDVNAAYSVLARHPLGNDAQVAAHFDFLKSLGATAQAATIVDAGLTRFPDSWLLHDRLRARLLAEKGAQALEPAYVERLAQPGATVNQEWFAGYASIVAAEFERRVNKPAPAFEAYARAIAHYERAIAANPASRDSSDHYVALALAGQARIELERGDFEAALDGLLASFARRSESAATLDGLNLSPADTATMLRAKLVEAKRDELAATLQAALDKLDPRLLELPAYEREGPRGATRNGRPPARGPGVR